jgi:hypothetical protein
LILVISLAGLGAAWLVAAQNTASLDMDATKYECARLVMERVHGFGYLSGTSSNSVSPPNGVDGASTPAPSDPLEPTWQSPAWQQYRYFDANLNELGSSDDGSLQIPPGTTYVATTTKSYAPIAPADAGHRPQSTRDDLTLMTVTVTVQQVNADGSLNTNDPVSLNSLMTEGGL